VSGTRSGEGTSRGCAKGGVCAGLTRGWGGILGVGLSTPGGAADPSGAGKGRTGGRRSEDPRGNLVSGLTRAADGTRIPVSLVYKKGRKRDGTKPLLLWGYGAYGFSIPVMCNPARLSLLDRGVIFALAHIRDSLHPRCKQPVFRVPVAGYDKLFAFRKPLK